MLVKRTEQVKKLETKVSGMFPYLISVFKHACIASHFLSHTAILIPK